MKLRYIRKKHEVADIWSFWFTPLDRVVWQAGQSLRLEIPAGYDTDERRFSIASAPLEGDIMITTRLSNSVFKQGLAALQPGTVVDAFAVEGSLLWGENVHPRLLVAVGIGITPFRALLTEQAARGTLAGTQLLYTGQPDSQVFTPYLRALAERTELHLAILPGRLLDVWAPQYEELRTTRIYLSGPSTTIEKAVRTLQSQSIPLDNITTDSFTGVIE